MQVKKELEMNGIEFYPQKEFDEDMEDKSDNDKIRVSDLGGFSRTTLPQTSLTAVRSSSWKCLASAGGDALCCGGQRQRISSEWQASFGQEDRMGSCRR